MKREKEVTLHDAAIQLGCAVPGQMLGVDPHPGVICIINDFVAVFYKCVVRQNGLSLQGENAIPGFNNNAIGEPVEPAISIIGYPGICTRGITARTLGNGFNRISDILQTHTFVIRSELVVRESLKSGSSGKVYLSSN